MLVASGRKRISKQGIERPILRVQYNLAQKIALMDMTRTSGIRTIAKKFAIHRSMLQKWLKKEDSIRMLALQRGINPYYNITHNFICPTQLVVVYVVDIFFVTTIR
jgi:hypothetical protein